MSDIPAVVCFLIGVYYFYALPYPGWKMGMAFGSAVLFRPSTGIFMVPFVAIGIARSIKNRQSKNLLAFLLAGILFLGFIAFYQFQFFGSPFLSGYSQKFTGIRLFSASYFPKNLIFYIQALSISFPLMILAPLCAKRTLRFEMLLSIIGGVLFFCFYYFHDTYGNKLQTLIFGSRFLFPALVLLLLNYCDVIDKFFLRYHSPKWGGIILLGFLASASAIFWRHDKLLQDQEKMKELIYSSTEPGSLLIYDPRSAELMQELWGNRRYVYWRDGNEQIANFLGPEDIAHGAYLIRRDHETMPWFDLEVIQQKQPLSFIAKYKNLEIYKFNRL